MLRRFYNWTMNYAGHHNSMWALAMVSFIESSFFPIPPDVLLIPMVLARRDRAWMIALVCTVSSVIGGFLGYAIGYYLFETVGRPILEMYHYTEKFMAFQAAFNEYGWWIIIIKGMTPIPFKLITIAAGLAKFPLWAFAIASVFSRAMRFFLVAGLLWKFGEPLRVFIEKYLTWLTTAFAVLLVGGILAFKFI